MYTRYTYICCDIPGNKKNMHIKYIKKKHLKNNRKMKIIKQNEKKRTKI